MADEEEDIISTLPDAILCHILSFLTTRQSVTTSILSKRWNPLWRSVQTLYFDQIITNQISNFDFNHIVYSILLSRDAAVPIKFFHLEIKYDGKTVECPIKSITKWVNFVVLQGVEYLYLHVISRNSIKFPITIFNCKTLVVLKLSFISMGQGFSSVLLPSLKTLFLEAIDFPGLQDLVLFLTGCPILEYLLISGMSFDSDESFDYEKSLTCSEWMSSFLTNLVRANIDCERCYVPLRAVHNVQSLRLELCQGYYHDDMIPIFHNLTQLKLICYKYCSKKLLLEVFNHCPKLQRFDLDENFVGKEGYAIKDDKLYWVFPEVVPQCLSLHLRTCNLLSFLGLHGELMLARYILKNARVLQTMKIWNHGQPEIERILSEFPRASATCKLTVNRSPREGGPDYPQFGHE